jgi:AcrR family transcriptional regulator
MTTPTGAPPPEPEASRRAGGREQALVEQRIGLVMAMIDAVGQNGYRATTVADVIARAGVSRKTFYKHFANKQECFVATYDLISAETLRRVAHAYRGAEGRGARAQAAIGALFEGATESPEALRLATVEIGALGSVGIERRDRSIIAYQRFVVDAGESAPGEGTMPEVAARAVVGGLNWILYRLVSSGSRAELLELVPDVAKWATSYYPTPPAITDYRPADAQMRARLDGGRAPGTLAPRSPLSARRGLARGNQNVSRSFVIHSQRERILDAVANLTAARGYSAVGIDDIAEEAAVSLQAFYEHFSDKEDALLVAYELGHAKGLAIVQREYAAQEKWPNAVRAAIAALFRFLASEPAFAHIALLDATTATSRTAERSNAGVNAFAQLLRPGMDNTPENARPRAVMIDAIAGGIFELCLHQAMRGRIQELPGQTVAATYIALAPFLGATQAARVATKQSPSR